MYNYIYTVNKRHKEIHTTLKFTKRLNSIRFSDKKRYSITNSLKLKLELSH